MKRLGQGLVCALVLGMIELSCQFVLGRSLIAAPILRLIRQASAG